MREGEGIGRGGHFGETECAEDKGRGRAPRGVDETGPDGTRAAARAGEGREGGGERGLGRDVRVVSRFASRARTVETGPLGVVHGGDGLLLLVLGIELLRPRALLPGDDDEASARRARASGANGSNGARGGDEGESGRHRAMRVMGVRNERSPRAFSQERPPRVSRAGRDFARLVVLYETIHCHDRRPG